MYKDLGGGKPRRLCTCYSRYRAWEVGHPGDCGHVTPVTGSWRWGHPGDCGHVTKSVEFGNRVLPLISEK